MGNQHNKKEDRNYQDDLYESADDGFEGFDDMETAEEGFERPHSRKTADEYHERSGGRYTAKENPDGTYSRESGDEGFERSGRRETAKEDPDGFYSRESADEGFERSGGRETAKEDSEEFYSRESGDEGFERSGRRDASEEDSEEFYSRESGDEGFERSGGRDTGEEYFESSDDREELTGFENPRKKRNYADMSSHRIRKNGYEHMNAENFGNKRIRREAQYREDLMDNEEYRQPERYVDSGDNRDLDRPENAESYDGHDRYRSPESNDRRGSDGRMNSRRRRDDSDHDMQSTHNSRRRTRSREDQTAQSSRRRTRSHDEQSTSGHHDRSGSDRRQSKKNKKKRKASTIIILVVSILAVFILALLLIAYVVVQYIHRQTNYVRDIDVTVIDDYDIKVREQDEPLESGAFISLEAEEEAILISDMENQMQDQDPIPQVMEKSYNLLLVGTDRRYGSDWAGNSDAMMLLTINDSTKTIYITSFMRDLYANVEGYGVRKLNSAHAIGGGPFLCDTLSANYGVKIDNYATTDFYNLETIINIMGGMDIDVTVAEANAANEHITWMNYERGVDPAPYLLTGTTDGTPTHLNGIQAVAYSRVRHIGNSDYERTSRQREVLLKLIEISKGMSLNQIRQLIDQFLPLVTHNISEDTVISLILRIPSLMSYRIEEVRIPFDG
ncbi:MAG: LCP family protein, partial [Parasporobacterium sp.]|nr:LCP family protein [Parasporobacterium sp.]